VQALPGSNDEPDGALLDKRQIEEVRRKPNRIGSWLKCADVAQTPVENSYDRRFLQEG
jgi:hypothetical protein